MMTPHKSHGRGTYVVDREFAGVGRINRASGTRDPEIFKAINGMLTTLYHSGRLDILEAVRDRQVKPLVVWGRYRTGELHKLPLGPLLAPLTESLKAWAETQEPAHRRSVLGTVRALAIPGDGNLADAPRLLAAYARRSTAPRMVELARAHLQGFFRDTLGAGHALWLEVKRVKPPKRAGPKQEQGKALTLPQLVELLPKLGKLDEGARRMALTMLGTGMGPKEYWRDGFDELDDRVLIHGEKRKGRDRAVPRWTPTVKPSLGYKRFRELLAKARTGTTPYALRKSYMRILEEAKIPRSRRKLYLGHGAGDVTGIYERHEVSEYLAADTALILAFVGNQLPTYGVKVA